MNNFEKTTQSNNKLSHNEKQKLLAFKGAVNGQLKFAKIKYGATNSMGGNLTPRGDNCSDCIVHNLWGIFGWSGIVLGLGLAACVVSTGGLCGAGIYAIIAAGYAVRFYAHCPQCLSGPPQVCNVCPDGYTYDGANCFSGAYFPTSGFVYNNAFYYVAEQPGNYCYIGLGFDSQHCLWNYVPYGYDPFIYGNSFYLKPHCQ